MVRYKLGRLLRSNLSINRLVLIVAIIEPLSTIPQILEIVRAQSSENVSLLGWILFMVGSVVWLAYGIKIKDTPLIASSLLWVLTELILVAAIVVYS